MEMKKKILSTSKRFIARFESACTAMGLIKKQEKCNLFGRGKATALWINAAYHDVTVNN
jgi:hypothetical protein